MNWVRRQPTVEVHTCPRPVREVRYSADVAVERPDGQVGDLWRCPGCRKLWLIEIGCDSCTWHGYCGRHYEGLILRPVWMPARWWQKIIHLRPAETRRAP